MRFVILQAIQDRNDVKLKRREDGRCISLLLKPEVIIFIQISYDSEACKKVYSALEETNNYIIC